jgi:hypothetical protein
MLEDARSALPPRRPGRTLARAFKFVWDRLRVASAGLSGVYFCILKIKFCQYIYIIIGWISKISIHMFILIFGDYMFFFHEIDSLFLLDTISNMEKEPTSSMGM